MFFAQLALICAAAFTGAAIYVSIVEQPARLGLEDAALLSQWKPAYKRGTALQGPLAIIACLFGLIAWRQSSNPGFLLGAILMIANWPWTFFAIMPTNGALMALDAARPAPQARALILRWGKLHAVRSALGALATLAFLMASLA
jgi:hypothetical protein